MYNVKKILRKRENKRLSLKVLNVTGGYTQVPVLKDCHPFLSK